MIARTRMLALAWLIATLAPLGSTAAAQESARAFLEHQHEEVSRILRQPAANDAARRQRTERVSTLLNGLLDYEALSRGALGDHWGERSAQERQQFVDLLRQLVQRNYESNLEHIVDYEVTYDAETRRGELTVVQTTARSRTSRREPPVAIEYALRSSGGQWRVVDVTTDGVSMVDNYRNQFHRIIARDGWSELITRMQRRLEQGGRAT